MHHGLTEFEADGLAGGLISQHVIRPTAMDISSGRLHVPAFAEPDYRTYALAGLGPNAIRHLVASERAYSVPAYAPTQQVGFAWPRGSHARLVCHSVPTIRPGDVHHRPQVLFRCIARALVAGGKDELPTLGGRVDS